MKCRLSLVSIAVLCAIGGGLDGARAFVMSMGAGPIAVIGPTGRLGRSAVQLLSDKGVATRVLCRHEVTDAAKATAGFDAPSSAEVMAYLATLPHVELVKGDITDAASLANLLQGCTACLVLHGATRTIRPSDLLPWTDESLEATHAKQVNFEGVRNVLAAARASQTCKRVVRVTGKGEAPWSFFSILINGVGCMAKAWNYGIIASLAHKHTMTHTNVHTHVYTHTRTWDAPKYTNHSMLISFTHGPLIYSLPNVARICNRHTYIHRNTYIHTRKHEYIHTVHIYKICAYICITQILRL